MTNVLPEQKKIKLYKRYDVKNKDYAACLKNEVTFLVAKIYKMNLYGWFFTCVRTCERWSFKDIHILANEFTCCLLPFLVQTCRATETQFEHKQ
jgi:hypothetical protein